MEISDFKHIVWYDLEIVVLKIHSISPWDMKMVSACNEPFPSKPIVNVYICPEDDVIFENPKTYRECIMRKGSYRGHNFGPPARLKCIDESNIAIFHPDPGQIIWSLIVKYVLTVYAVQANLLHLKGAAIAQNEKAFLFLGRGGSGKTEVVKALCEKGAGFLANTHLLIDRDSVCGVKSNMRIRDKGRDVYVSVDDHAGLDRQRGWLPIGGVFWVNYRTDGKALVQLLSPGEAKANLRYFSESVSNWEIKEDIADYSNLDPFEFAGLVNNVDAMLDEFCQKHKVYYFNADIRSNEGMARLTSAMEAVPNC